LEKSWLIGYVLFLFEQFPVIRH